MGELNLAILGCGLVGKRHVDAIFKTERINLIDIIDHDPTSLQGVNNLHNINVHNDLDNYLNNNQPDGIITVSYTHLTLPTICSV